MSVARIAFCIAGLALLAGCAAPRQPMQDTQYHEFAKLRTGVLKCAATGKMPPELASRGIGFLNNKLADFSYDTERLQRVQALYADKEGPTQEECNTAAVHFHTLVRQSQANYATGVEQQKAIQNQLNNRPVQTYCNRIGTQTLCSSY